MPPDLPVCWNGGWNTMGWRGSLKLAVVLTGVLGGFAVAASSAAPGATSGPTGVTTSAPVAGQRTVLQMLEQLQDGRWELRLRGAGGVQRLCIGDRRRLVQMRHPDLACERLILEDTPGSVTVQYTCRGHGYGRTHIRRETGRLIQVETQGVVDGLPFDYAAEGRWIGDCAAS